MTKFTEEEKKRMLAIMERIADSMERLVRIIEEDEEEKHASSSD